MLELTFCRLDAEIVFDALADTSMLELTFCKLDADDLVRFWHCELLKSRTGPRLVSDPASPLTKGLREPGEPPVKEGSPDFISSGMGAWGILLGQRLLFFF